MTPNRDTPAMRQYRSFKEKYPDCILFFRMGDFYEMFDQDAVTAHRVLGITLTERTSGIPMAGVPYHSVEGYLRRMIEQGYRVAVCDQIQDPREAKGVVERAVSRVVTPGTLVDEALLSDDAPNQLACVAFLDSGDAPDARVAAAVVELSTGAFHIFERTAAQLVDELARREVSELLCCETANGVLPPRLKKLTDALSIHATMRPSWHFRPTESLEAITQQFGVTSLEGFGVSVDDPAIIPAGVIIRYLRETQAIDASFATSDGASSGSTAAQFIRPRSLSHLRPPRRETESRNLILDVASLRALEVERPMRTAPNASSGAPDGSLLSVFSTGNGVPCRTAMGKRLLREWLKAPPCDIDQIRSRQDAVSLLVSDRRLAEALSTQLSGVQDVARLGARIALARATPRDLVALGRSLAHLDSTIETIAQAPALQRIHKELSSLSARLAPIAAEIAKSCVDDPPSHLREGGLIRDGIDAALDEARELQRESGKWLTAYQKQLLQEHDLPSLKVGYNKVFGYYIELPAAQARRAPASFTRKQTLKNAERYITPELKEYEDKVLTAGDRAIQREHELFNDLCARIASITQELATFADLIAELDVYLCFAARAALKGWVRPELVEQPVLEIIQGRHPVLESVLADRFVPNDIRLGAPTEDAGEPSAGDDAAPSLALITGPNMAGKSTYIRQVALLALLAHTGSFVPAERATIGLTDRIFTRIGADDALHAGQSTFMVEMVETANILNNASPRSLIILDEIGRGTSTLDGLSLAWAIAEHLAHAASCTGDKSGAPASPRTLFATHYHELTDLADRLPGRVVNLHVAVREWGEEIVFLHQILPGRTNQSYGIHVAKLAGLPRSTVDRAQQLLESLSVSHSAIAPESDNATESRGKSKGKVASSGTVPLPERSQLNLFTEFVMHPAVEELRELKLDALSPLQAFDLLRQVQDRLRTSPPVDSH